MSDDTSDELKTLKREVSKLKLEANLRKSLAEQLEKQKIIATQAKVELEERHRNLISSLNYASHIQQSIMPSLETIRASLPGAFIYWAPQHIVGGDAFFMKSQSGKAGGDAITVFSVYDCTGPVQS